MKSVTVWRTLCACGLFAAFNLSSAIAAPINTAAEWDATMLGYHPSGTWVPIKTDGDLPDQDAFAWNGYMWIEAYVALAQSTGDVKYMNLAKQIIDYELTLRDDVRFVGTNVMTTPYWSAPTYNLFHYNPPTPAKGWRRLIASGDGYGQVSQLIDGRICESIVLWCELARRGFPQFEPNITSYLATVKETLEMHLPSFYDVPPTQNTTGHIYTPTLAAKSFKYWWEKTVISNQPPSDAPKTWTRFMAMNHNCTFARAMMGYDQLKGTTLYRDKVQGVVNFYLNSLDTANPLKAFWMYSPLDMSLNNPEDVNHATVTLSLIEEAYRVGGYGVDISHVNRLVQTFHTFYNTTTKGVSYFIDGTGAQQERTSQTGAIGMKSWLWLSQFDPTIADKVRASYVKYFATTGGVQAMTGWANLVYWDSLLDGTAAFDDTSIAATKPIYNDTVNDLLWPYYVQTTSAEVTTGSPSEGTKHTQINYNIVNPALLTSVVYTFSPAKDALVWGGIKLSYKTSGPAACSLVLMDGIYSMTATLPAQTTYASRTLRWSDFTNQSAVNKAAVTKIRFITNGAPAGSAGTLFFDDVKFVP